MDKKLLIIGLDCMTPQLVVEWKDDLPTIGGPVESGNSALREGEPLRFATGRGNQMNVVLERGTQRSQKGDRPTVR